MNLEIIKHELPRTADSEIAARIDALVAAGDVTMIVQLGELLIWHHCNLTVEDTDYPYIILRLNGTGEGYDKTKDEIKLNAVLTWKGARWRVIRLQFPMMALECIAFTEAFDRKLKKSIAKRAKMIKAAKAKGQL